MAVDSIQWAVGRECGKGLDGRGYLLERLIWVLQAEESPRYWMQDRNLKEDNCFKNKNIMNLDCTATSL